MPDQPPPFSRRHGYSAQAVPITVREDAPDDLRYAVLGIAVSHGMRPGPLRAIACRILLIRPNQDNWSEYPNIWGEVDQLLEDCSWYRVYDIAEEIRRTFWNSDRTVAESYENELNAFFVERGIGWEMRNGEILVRGSETFSSVTAEAEAVLTADGRNTAARELHEALQDLSRRPGPDLSGAIQHANAALECVARDVSGQPSATLGQLLNRHSDQLDIPPPLDQALSKLWGFASGTGRHLEEGRDPRFEEAELVVGVAAAVSTYLTKKARAPNGS